MLLLQRSPLNESTNFGNKKSRLSLLLGTRSGRIVNGFSDKARVNSQSHDERLYQYALELSNSNNTGGLQVDVKVDGEEITSSISFSVNIINILLNHHNQKAFQHRL